ncbi:MAG: quinone-interacting membrane-bound oxidoreductase complex subunit QmoC [bacterium]
MPDKYLIEPDAQFIRTMTAMGAEAVKKCFQCATCSAVCPISPDSNPFPRKEMIWAQWGLKDRLLNDPDVWLCHQCNDCSVYCPRGGSPGDLLAAVRNYTYLNFAVPRFMGRALSRAIYLPLLFILPVIIFLGILYDIGNLRILEGEIIFANFMPLLYVDSVFLTVSALVMLSIAASVRRFWKNLNTSGLNPAAKPSRPLLSSIVAAAVEVMTHTKFKDCGTNRIRYSGHLATFYGFIGLFITTTLVFIGIYVLEYGFGLHILVPPLSLLNPVKIFANLSAIAIFIGLTIVIYNRIKRKDKAGKSTYYDWVFIIVLYTITITGILTELTRLAEIAALAYSLYFLHLVFVFFLIAYFPYSKFAHLIYRFVAIVHSKYTNRYGETL